MVEIGTALHCIDGVLGLQIECEMADGAFLGDFFTYCS
jgi:hypothetical protein